MSRPPAPPCALLGVDYDEFDVDSFRGLRLSYDDQEESFASGDPVADFEAVTATLAALESRGYVVMHLSSVDHFITDSKHPEGAAQVAPEKRT